MKKYITVVAMLLSLVIPEATFAQIPADIDPQNQTMTCPSLQNNLRYQSRDSFTSGEVSTLQDFLQSRGYLNSEPTGYFGLLTFQAAKDFQSANGISPTGFVGPITRAKIASMYNCMTTVTPITDQTLPTIQPTISFFTPTYSVVNLGKSSTLSWRVLNATRCVLQYDSIEKNVDLIGTKTVYPKKTTSYQLWCVNEPNDGKDGISIKRSTSIGVIPADTSTSIDQSTVTSPTPTCTLSANKSSYNFGETITYSWTSKNATYASFQQDTSGKDSLWLPSDKLSANGSEQVVANIIGNPSATLIVGGTNNTIGSCSKTVNVTSNSLETVSFDQNTLKVTPNTAITLSGITSVESDYLTVAIIGPSHSGATDWNTVSNLLKGDSSYTAMSKTIPLYGENWSSSFGSIGTEGYYTVLIYDDNHKLIGKTTLWITYKG